MTNPPPTPATADLCDAHGDKLRVCEPVFHVFGGRRAFHGPISTILSRYFSTGILPTYTS